MRYVVKGYLYGGDVLKMKTRDFDHYYDDPRPEGTAYYEDYLSAEQKWERERDQIIENFKRPDVYRIEYWREGTTDHHIVREP